MVVARAGFCICAKRAAIDELVQAKRADFVLQIAIDPSHSPGLLKQGPDSTLRPGMSKPNSLGSPMK
jgi:hypothetical protein